MNKIQRIACDAYIAAFPTSAGGMTFYEEQFETGVWLGLTQFINAFNAAGANSIILSPGARKGRKPTETVIDDVAGLIQRRDPSGTGTLTPTGFGNSEHTSIKLFRSAPMKLTRQDWIDQGFGTEAGTRLFGEQFGQGQAQDYLNTVIAALVGAINSIGADAVHDISGSGTLDFPALNQGLGKMGDRRSAIRSFVSYSKPLTDLVGTAFTSQQVAFQVGSTTITNGMIPHMGLREINTDAPSLFIDNTGTDHYNSLGLVLNAARVRTGPSSQIFNPITGDGSTTPENQQWLLSIEYEFEITVKGVTFDGVMDNPTDAQLADPSNWSLIASNRKLGPGFLVLSQ